MPFETWVRFVAFWILFVTTPGPNAVNCITNGQAFGFWRSLPGVAAILAQATLFLTLGATGVAGLLLAAPQALVGLQIAGAAVLIWFGVRGWHRAKSAISQPAPPDPNRMFWTGFAIATFNPKSIAGYLAGMSQFLTHDLPLGAQLMAFYPTALLCTTLSYCGYTYLGARLGRSAMGAIGNQRLRQGLATCLGLYGVGLLGLAIQALL